MAKPMASCPFGLTVSEARVLRAVMRHEGYKQAADEACLAEDTLKDTMQRVYRKLGVANRVQTAVKATRHGLLPFAHPAAVELTTTELMVVRQMPTWAGSKTAARDLGIARCTVDWHLKRVYKKLGVVTIIHCAVAVERAGLLKDLPC